MSADGLNALTIEGACGEDRRVHKDACMQCTLYNVCMLLSVHTTHDHTHVYKRLVSRCDQATLPYMEVLYNEHVVDLSPYEHHCVHELQPPLDTTVVACSCKNIQQTDVIRRVTSLNTLLTR